MRNSGEPSKNHLSSSARLFFACMCVLLIPICLGIIRLTLGTLPPPLGIVGIVAVCLIGAGRFLVRGR